MLKFAPKNHKQVIIAIKREKKIRLYNLVLTLPGTLGAAKVNTAVWKYLLSFHIYYKTFSSLSHSRKVCALNGRSRGIYRGFQLSRMKIRENIGAGFFVGISKASW